jgi:hypothetical protein
VERYPEIAVRGYEIPVPLLKGGRWSSFFILERR